MMRIASSSDGIPKWYPPSPTMEVSTPVLPSLRVGTRAPAGTLYLPLGTFPEGAPPACSFAAARAARAMSTPPAAACRNLLLEAMQYLLPREAAHAAPTRHPHAMASLAYPAFRMESDDAAAQHGIAADSGLRLQAVVFCL